MERIRLLLIANFEVLEIQLVTKGEDCVVWPQNATLYRKLTEDDIKIAIQ